MYKPLQSIFLAIPRKVSQEFIHAAEAIVSDARMNMEIAADMRMEEFAETLPKTARCVRNNLYGFFAIDRVSSPYVMAPVSLLAALTSPIPADSPIHLTNLVRHSKTIGIDLYGHFNGAHRRRKVEVSLEALAALGERTDGKHMILASIETYSINAADKIYRIDQYKAREEPPSLELAG